ncbi:MAG TPA: multidrug efflux RND transporter permease subunit [Burkholderiales bacterium]|nr:multidrug efflux RND transporter permease subunit [Burkholderiales bacterium]
MLSRVFIDRPIFAAVLSLLIFIGGLIAMYSMPVSEYPEVVPPSVVVRAVYPGANPQAIAESVAAPLEEQINGVENMLYMSSQATTDGVMMLTVTFKIGTNIDTAETQVQNRVQRALPRMPEEVRQIGVTTEKSSPDFIMVIHILSPDSRYDELYLRNYAVLNVKDVIARIPGMGQTQVFGGGDYAMRIWLDPQKVAARNLTATDIVQAIREQNVQVAAGVVGAPPSKDSDFQLSVNTQGRLTTEEEFANIIINAKDGRVTYLRDVARIELGQGDYALRSLLNNKPAVGIGVFQAPGSNAIALSNTVRAEMERLKQNFPEGVDYAIVYDPTRFVQKSIEAVIETLFEAILLVVLVVIIFLQTWRASIIPLAAVPVSIVGTFGLLLAFGFSINALTLFGLVLAIGIVVDDAIVVVENVERNIELGYDPKEATYRAMKEVSGPIIAIALTLCAVFVPIAFISGLTGQFYKQFALTIVISTIISAFNSLTLSPALAAILLKPHDAPKDRLTRFMDRSFGWFFTRFDRFFRKSANRYQSGVRRVLNRKTAALIVYAVLIGLTYFMFKLVPGGFVPQQDKEYLVGFAQLPEGASLDRTDAVIRRISAIAMETPGIKDAVAFPGLSIAGFSNAPNEGIVFFTLKDFEARKSANLTADAIAMDVNQRLGGIQDAFIAVFPPPPVNGIGQIGGFKMQIEDRAALGNEAIFQAMEALKMKAYQTPELMNVFSSFQINVPQIYANLDREKAKRMGVPVTDVFNTMQIYMGSLYVNDFNRFGRTYRVVVQADAPYRSHADDIATLKTRNAAGEMLPLGSVMTVEESYGPGRAMRYNAFPTADLNGAAGMGYSSGEAQAAIERIAKEVLPRGMTYEWTDLTYQEILAGNTAILVFPLCVLLVFLVLAAQYESFTMPLAVILIVPMCLLCAITGVHFTGGDNNIFTQIALFVLVGLACKNAILIVEFARELEIQGHGVVDAALEACRLRLRPILMTSFAFIMGVVPLALSSGAGSEMRQAMGIAVFWGMLGVTFFGLLLTPVFYVVLRSFGKRPHAAGQMRSDRVPAVEGNT